MLIHSLFLSSLETALSHYVSLDPDAEVFLKPVAGKVIKLTLDNPSFSIFLCPTANSIQILEQYEGIPDTCLQGTLIAFATMGLKQRPTDALFSGEISISGDTNIGREFQTLFERLDIDWEEQISRLTGDVIGHQIGRVCRSAAAWGKDTVESFKLNVSEYLQEETRDLPTPIETEHLFRDIDELRADFDRLQLRFNRLYETSIKPNA